MTEDRVESNEFTELRMRAEAELKRKAMGDPDLSPEESRRLVHQLQTHQIELEMQNEELRRAQQELIESRDRYSDLYDSIPAGCVTISHKGLILEANVTLAGMLGFERGLLAKQRWSTFIAPDDQDVFYRHRREVLEAKQRRTCRLRMLKRDAESFWAEMDSVLLAADDPNDAQLRIAIHDVTAQKLAEEALQESEAKYSLVVEHARDGLAVVQDGVFAFVNGAMAEMVGYSVEELSGMPFLDLVAEDDKAMVAERNRQHIAGEETPIPHEMRLVSKDGATTYTEQSAVLIEYRGRPATLGIVRDITRRRRLEEQLRHAHKMEAIGQLAAGVAHEFNNMLVGILGNAQALLASLDGKLREDCRLPLELIEKSGKRAAALTQQLLTFARKKHPVVSIFDLNQTVADTERMLRQLIGEHILLETDLASDRPVVRADENEVERAILNLATNARDAMPDGGTLTIRTTLVTFDRDQARKDPHAGPGTYGLLSVADTGRGMAPETVERVFEPFFTTKPVGQGTGLGLSTVFGDVTNSNGFVEVESRLGHGTVFHIYLPVAEEDVVAARSDPERPEARRTVGRETILVCDDDDIVLDSVAYLLKSVGYTVLAANGAREALELAASHAGPLPLLLTDVLMPEMNGWELAKQLTQLHPDIKIIYMSGYGEDLLEVGAAEGVQIEFLQKPPMDDALLHRIREILNTPTR